MLFYLFCGAFTTLTAYGYLYKNNVQSGSNIATVLLASVLGLYSAPVILKSFTVMLNDVQTHRFQLVKKNGGYQRWKSLSDDSLEIRLGSVSNNIHTENSEGAIIELKLVEGRFLTLYLPGEIERTRYRLD